MLILHYTREVVEDLFLRRKENSIYIVLFVLLLFPYIEPTYVSVVNGIIHNIYSLLTYINTALVILYALYKRHYKPSKAFVTIVVLYIWIIVLSIINAWGAESAVKSLYKSVMVCFIFDFFLQKRPRELIRGLSIILSVYIIINFGTILLYPNGMYTVYNEALGHVSQNWFLGYKNPQIRLILPAITIKLVDNYMHSKDISNTSLIMLTISMISCVMVDSGTAIFGMLIVVIMIFLFSYIKRLKFFNTASAFFISIAIFIGFAFLNLQGSLSSLFENIIRRDLTLNSRTTIWYNYLSYLVNHPFGSGYIPTRDMFSLFRTSHPHNYFLYLLLQGGVIGLVIVGYLNFGLKKLSNEFSDSQICHVLVTCCVAFLFMGITESLTEAILLYPMSILLGNIKHVVPYESRLNNYYSIAHYLTAKRKISLKRRRQP